MPRLSVQQLFDSRREKLQLTWNGGQKGASRELTHEALNRPGVGLVGHLNLIHPILIQALGLTDLEYLNNQPSAARTESLVTLCALLGFLPFPPSWSVAMSVSRRCHTDGYNIARTKFVTHGS